MSTPIAAYTHMHQRLLTGVFGLAAFGWRLWAGIFYIQAGETLKKKEILFILGILAAAALLWAGTHLMDKGELSTVRITVAGKEYGTYSLSKDQVISIGDTNRCEIKDGEIKMIWADCPDHLCMKQHAIDKNGGTIVCLPNKVVIEGKKSSSSNSEDELVIDSVT